MNLRRAALLLLLLVPLAVLAACATGRAARTFPPASDAEKREALAALQIFCEAAEHEATTVELTRRVIWFLHQSQYDPGLKFEAGEVTGAP